MSHYQISDAYWKFKDIEGFAKVKTCKELLLENDGNLKISLYVKPTIETGGETIDELRARIEETNKLYNSAINKLAKGMNEIGL